MRVCAFSYVYGPVVAPLSSITTPANQRPTQAELRESLYRVAQNHASYPSHDATLITSDAYVCGLEINMLMMGANWIDEVATGIQPIGDATCSITAQPTLASRKSGSHDQAVILHENYSVKLERRR